VPFLFSSNEDETLYAPLPITPLPTISHKRSRTSEVDEEETYERLSKSFKSGNLLIPRFTHHSTSSPFSQKSAFKRHTRDTQDKENIPTDTITANISNITLKSKTANKKKIEENTRRLRQVAHLNIMYCSLFEEMREVSVCINS